MAAVEVKNWAYIRANLGSTVAGWTSSTGAPPPGGSDPGTVLLPNNRIPTVLELTTYTAISGVTGKTNAQCPNIDEVNLAPLYAGWARA